MTRWSRSAFLSLTASVLALPPSAFAQTQTADESELVDGLHPKDIAKHVRDEFLHAWNGYKRFAWGHDEVAPIAGKPKDFFVDGHSFGLSIIEAMDTLYIMGADDELAACVKWLQSHLHFDVDAKVQMFEAVIRMVAGLMTGYYATGERFLLDAAHDLADRFMPCFTKSPSGAPYRFANLRTGAVSDPMSNLAEIGSNILEFGDLSRLTGDPKYVNASMKAYETVVAKRSRLNLLGTNFDVEKGEFSGTDDVAPDEPVDSFYEYLWGGWQMLGNVQTRDWYRMLTDAILKYKSERINGNLWFRTVNYKTGAKTSDTTMSELAAFYAELAAKGGNRDAGEAFYDSWTVLLDKYQLIPEVINYADLSVVDPKYWMRPEYPNSSFDLWFLTKDQKYRRTAYRYFQALRANCRTQYGYTTLNDVRTRPMTAADYFPAYSFSENFKYLYCMFNGSDDRFDGSTYYFNTEGKALRGLLRNGKPAHLA
ncbi:MAG TPA: glycoside hydrolase family 47 protein [Candidatus Baltobacteraceae bacterium]|nr:glycoside hydrolase family 47 protein [Candidatus Baltobacteraceae bacterium]